MATTTRVQSLAESGIESVPPQYLWPGLHSTINTLSPTQLPKVLPIDLQGLSTPHRKENIIAEISSATENWGFFVIVNHGIPESITSCVQEVVNAFFEFPLEEKELYKAEGGNSIGYGSKVGTSGDAKLEWKDYYYNVVWPATHRDMSK
ncbi:hypothetical protein SUGI_0873900 [Cryptomeria japonica]|uniref:leucoanthocyanidin dioxygenase-like n=1 Tax=Cryptomeria japonica TaxID=3369 RepID=UPI002414B782|nr:leucoanthocyanidin dioxygenase-like [Cryptomeria japonica]GLJ42211.1 hypothetical protein SUGI_0873900 [Cryptomeria japonica]